MYFNFEDFRPDTPTLPRSLTRLEVALLTVVFYLSVVILILVWPHLEFVKAWEAEREQQMAKLAEEQLQRQRESPRFVFVQPRVDLQAPKPPPKADLSDLDRKARTVERAPKPTNNMVTDVVVQSLEGGLTEIRMSDRILDATVGLRSFLFAAVYENEVATAEFKKAGGILGGLWEKVRERPAEFLDRRTIDEEGLDAAARDFLAGMTDRYAVSLYEQLFIPKSWVGGGEER